MKRSSLLTGALCALLVPAAGCDLLSVSDNENASGRGAKVFDPYQAAASGAIRLSLQQFNGCAVMPDGQMGAKGDSPVPDSYPTLCPSLATPLNEPTATLVPPTGRLRIQGRTKYFLNQFTITDTVVDVESHKNAGDLAEPVRWIKTQSRFKNLNWSNLGQVADEWKFIPAVPGSTQDSWARQVLFDNADWRKVRGDGFKVEILNADGTVVGTPVSYERAEFVTDTSSAGHSRIMWRMERVMPPQFPGDTAVHPTPQLPGWPPSPPVFRTMVRLDFVGSTNPFKTFDVPDLRGPGALRVTWSQLPDEPFYFPVDFVPPSEVEPGCTDDAGNPTTCGFGLDPRLKLSKPANGKFYMPGETMNLFVDIRDNEGNRLHNAQMLPSGFEAITGKSNGLLYTQIPFLDTLLEYDMVPAVQIAGPLHKMTPRSNPTEKSPFFGPDFFWALVDEPATVRLPTGQHFMQWPTRVTRTLPTTAEPGTYVALIKSNRYFMGERTSKLNPFFFQVGQEERTTYPNAVGNCQICHRGVLSLDNLRHGLSVDHVESCKVCHSFNNDLYNRPQDFVHKIHMSSPRYPSDKGDCTMCHLTRESALRPSITVCASCHPSAHDNQYFQVKFSNTGEPSRFGNCAQSCHVDTPPKGHILPAN